MAHAVRHRAAAGRIAPRAVLAAVLRVGRLPAGAVAVIIVVTCVTALVAVAGWVVALACGAGEGSTRQRESAGLAWTRYLQVKRR